jgi:hypothetical protein
LVMDGIRIDHIVEAYIGRPPHLGLVAHELSHILLNTADMYFVFFYPYASGAYSLMDQHWRHPHLDPFHKLRLGWIAPKIVTAGGQHTIRDVETRNDALVLYDPEHSDREYFVLENRWPATERALPSYDRDLPDRGLAVWHIIEDPAIFGQLAAPPRVDPVKWNSVGAQDWGRRAVRMIRPIYGPPFDDSKALWDSSDYDLESVDANPDHATLKWADGSPSGFAIRDIPPAGPEMTVTIEFDRP